MSITKVLIPGTLIALALAGCGGSGGNGDDQANDESSTGGSGGSMTDTGSASTATGSGSASSASTTMSDTSVGSVDDSSGSASGSATEATDASATATETTDATADSTGNDTGLSCEPTGTSDCGDCIVTSCCDQIQECGADAECACVLDCLFVLMNGDPAFCTEMCMLPELPPGILVVVDCVMAECQGIC